LSNKAELSPEQKQKTEDVGNMFNSIAHRYDFLNHFLSFGIDYYWRRRVMKILKKVKPERILDLATGTGDLAILAAKTNPKEIVGVDISSAMLHVGEEKIRKKNLQELIRMEQGAAENLPTEDNYFDLAMVAFGVRNFADLQRGLREINRTLKPGGSLIVLEFSHPTGLMKPLYSFYSKNILPTVGRVVSKDPAAYTYLPESVAKFPSGVDFDAIMKESGFVNTKMYPLTSGISTIYVGEKLKA
jgi:demethylmenaquinone methyltransferase/2-methoxy-6-polyprenyl-1,4-benzoquinol methylase